MSRWGPGPNRPGAMGDPRLNVVRHALRPCVAAISPRNADMNSRERRSSGTGRRCLRKLSFDCSFGLSALGWLRDARRRAAFQLFDGSDIRG